MKISIIIPTFNRSKYLDYTLKTCLNQNYNNVEFIIHDDCSIDETEQVSNKYCKIDKRFKYFKLEKNLGMKENFEQALLKVNGDYVMCIGGDDALMPNSLNELAKEAKIYPNKILTWPTAAYFYAEARENIAQLIVPNISFNKKNRKIITTKEFFEKQIENLFYVNDPEVPMLYVKSLVPAKLIEEVKSRSENIFFSSSTPDGYSAFALCSVVENYIYITKTYTMHGVSPTSAGLNYIQGQNNKNDLSTKFFSDNEKNKMANELARQSYSPLISIMTADFIYNSDNQFKHGYSNKIKINTLIENSIDELRDGLMSDSKINRELEIIKNIAIYHNIEDVFLNKIKNTWRNKRKTLTGNAISSRLIYIDANKLLLKDVVDATEYLNKYLNSKRIYMNFRWMEAFINSIQYYLSGIRKAGKIIDCVNQ
jgi:glycosyltransferase involved in cell wall biosynthesis